MKKSKLFSMLFREKPVELLIKMNNSQNKRIYASVVAKEIDCTYSHVVKLLKTLKKSGIIEFEKHGRLKYLTLTETGRKIADHLFKIKELIENK